MTYKNLIFLLIVVVFAAIALSFISDLSYKTGAFVQPVYVNDTAVKFYDDNADQEECLDRLEALEDYTIGLDYVLVYSPDDEEAGRYWTGGTLYLYGCTWHNLNHELAHNMQYVNGENQDEINNHLASFNNYEKEIHLAIVEANGGVIPPINT